MSTNTLSRYHSVVDGVGKGMRLSVCVPTLAGGLWDGGLSGYAADGWGGSWVNRECKELSSHIHAVIVLYVVLGAGRGMES